ncbi:MAG: hypothetical protein GY757_52170, partial [bacterium]|nr:hypothetical protein [bacterium]
KTATLTQPKPLSETAPPAAQEAENPLPPELFHQLQLELARRVGPIAKILLNKEIKKMGWTMEQFPEKALKVLVNNLKDKVEESKRDQFIEAVQELEYQYKQRRLKE